MSRHVFGAAAFDRAAVPPELRDLSLWPSVDLSALDEEEQRAFLSRQAAIRLYIEEPFLSLSAIARQTGVDRKLLYRMIDRCIERHPDGRIYGFRAAIRYARLKEYERVQAVNITSRSSGAGLSGAFTDLLQRYPQLEKMLLRYAKLRKRYRGRSRKARWPLGRIHQNFLKKCRELGVRPNEYPLNQASAGIRSLATFFKRHEMAAPDQHGGANGLGKTSKDNDDSTLERPVATRAFQVIEFDGHKIDLRVTVRLTDPLGFTSTVELTRIWILVLLDVASRAVLGYKLALSMEYNKDDVAAALQAALVPFRPRQYLIPGLAMRAGGGFPSSALPQTEYACWDWFRFDGAKSHLAADTVTRLNQVVGCWPDNGPAGEPNKRPFVERFFRLIAEHFAHRLPGTTGSNPDSIERLLNDPHGDLSLLVEIDELEDMIEVLIGDYNGAPHSGIFGRTPLETMSQLLARDQGYLRTLPRVVRQNLCLLQEATIKPIKGNVQNGVAAHINFQNVRYSSDIVRRNPALIGQKIRIYYDVRDIRTVKAFFEDGAELGILTAAKPWCFTPHSLRVRQEIFRLKQHNKLRWRDGDDPVECWEKMKRQQARTNKRAATDLAKARSYQKVASVQENPSAVPPAAASEATPAGSSVANPPLLPPDGTPSVPPQPRVLRLKRTLTF